MAKLSAATCRISSISCRSILVLFRLRSTSAATWRISCNPYADALNSTEFCIVRLFLRHFIRHHGILNPICVKLLPLMCAVIMHNSVKKNEVSILINGWVTANYSVSRPPFCSPSWNLKSDLCQTLTDYVRCYSTQFKNKNDVCISNRFPEVHKCGIHTHRHRHTHTRR